MRLRWQLAVGGGILALGIAVLAGAYTGGEPGTPRRQVDDPLFLLLALAAGAAVGLGGGSLLERPLRQLAGAARRADPDDRARLTAPDLAAAEIVEVYRALSDLHARHADLALSLREEKARVEVILDSITEGILVTDRDGRILLANRALRDLFGVVRSTAGRRPAEVVRNATVGEAIEQVLAGAGVLSREVTLGASAQRHLDVHVGPIADADEDGTGTIAGTVVVFYEITRLRRLERTRADFVANVSHELRTPLTAIKGCAETLADGAIADPEVSARFVSVIASHADRLTNLLNDLLDLSRLESDQTHVEVVDAPVQRLVDTAREAVSGQARDRGIQIDVEIPEGLTARCDRQLIEQALINLLDNAVKYTPADGNVRVSARRVQGEAAILELARKRWSAGGVEHVGDDGDNADLILLEVADTGIGIPSTDVERVFERFYRVDRGRSRDMGGTGLGLSIVRHVVEMHGQRFFVDSELGHGSVFGFTLTAA